jgi:hypothetical protein
MDTRRLILTIVLSLNISATGLAIVQPSLAKDVMGMYAASIAGLYGYLAQEKPTN